MCLRLITALVSAAWLVSTPAAAQTFTLGETNQLPIEDQDNGGLVLVDGPWNLTVPAKLINLSILVTEAAGALTLGIYTAGANNDCIGGALVAQTNEFTSSRYSWNTAPPAASIILQPGAYCLAFMPSSPDLVSRKGQRLGVGNKWFAHSSAEGTMPPTFPYPPTAADKGEDLYYWSLYATLSEVSLNLSVNPPLPTIAATAAPGSAIATVTAAWSDGSPFTGTLSFDLPYQNDGGAFALAGNQVVVGPGGIPLGDLNTTQTVTITATQ